MASRKAAIATPGIPNGNARFTEKAHFLRD